jgi:hypothetical protein
MAKTETTGRKPGRIYRFALPVPFYETRRVEIRFEKASPRTPRAYVDGPSSPHRYPDGSLCIWYPLDPPDERWVFDEGLMVLINYIQAHLFREAWWRETGEWLGPQVPHDPPKSEVRVDSDDDA